MKYVLLISSLLLLQACVSTPVNLCQTSTNNCTFALFSENSNSFQIVNKKRAAQRFTPASTFKIANSLIALETNIVASAQAPLFIDSSKYPRQAWWQAAWIIDKEYSLKTAFKQSVVPIYQSIASDIGQVRMANFLETFNYGNQDISSGIDTFWLGESLKISALEQIELLRHINNNDFRLRESSLKNLREIMLLEETNSYKLFAKTGAAFIQGGELIAWYVGFVENSAGTHYFAFNLQGEPSPKIVQDRIDFTLNHLKHAGVI